MRCPQPNVISYSLIKSYFSDEHISTFNSSPVSRRPHSSKSVRMHHLASLVSKYSKQLQLPKHCFKQFCLLQTIRVWGAFLTSSEFLVLLASKMFSAVPTSFVLNSARMYHFVTLLSQQFQPQEHRFKQLQSAPYIALTSNFSQQFQLQEYHFKQGQNAPYP